MVMSHLESLHLLRILIIPAQYESAVTDVEDKDLSNCDSHDKCSCPTKFGLFWLIM